MDIDELGIPSVLKNLSQHIVMLYTKRSVHSHKLDIHFVVMNIFKVLEITKMGPTHYTVSIEPRNKF